jgi:hypothetical protein
MFRKWLKLEQSQSLTFHIGSQYFIIHLEIVAMAFQKTVFSFLAFAVLCAAALTLHNTSMPLNAIIDVVANRAYSSTRMPGRWIALVSIISILAALVAAVASCLFCCPGLMRNWADRLIAWFVKAFSWMKIPSWWDCSDYFEIPWQDDKLVQLCTRW